MSFDEVSPAGSARSNARALVARLSLSEKVGLLTGASTWTLHAIPKIGLRSITMSDGPIGVRGVGGDSDPSAQLPAPSAMAASWDRELLAQLGTVMAAEARRKGVDVILAPVVNLQRSPVGGRHFECFSEDPELVAGLAVPYIAAIQNGGIGATAKHLIGNETETDRTTYVARIDERTLREVYLAPFEAIIRETGAWAIMAAYNGLSGLGQDASATAHHGLLTKLLKEEWGYDGVIVSDWLATKDTVESANAGLDLVMPGPGGPWEQSLEEAVERGDVSIETIDDKVARLLLLADRVGALGEPFTSAVGEDQRVREKDAAAPKPDAPEVRALLREAVARTTVVLRNEGALLPLDGSTLTSVALIGANAVTPFVQGGGSAHVDAPLLSDPLTALRRALPAAVVTLHRGGATMVNAPDVTDASLTTPDGDQGIAVDVLDHSREIIEQQHLASAVGSIWLGDLPENATFVRIRTAVALDEPGEHTLEVAPVGAHRALVDGTVLTESATSVGPEVVLNSSYANPEATSVRLKGGRAAALDITIQVVDADAYGRFARLHLRHRVPGPSTNVEIEQAVNAARGADVAVVVVGTNNETESEGWDRRTLALPGRQDELVRRVAAANPRTVVVVNAGAPVLLPWLDSVASVLWWWLPGQEAGDALAEVLLGVTEPSGRLPWTLPASELDVPVPNGIPVDGIVDYAEGVDVGHRAWDRLHRIPAREFGFGIGYGRWSYDSVDLGEIGSDGSVTVAVRLTNVGDRKSREAVQIYVEPDEVTSDRPVRWLAGFTTVDAEAGETVTVSLCLQARVFQIWDVAAHDWATPACTYTVHAARSSRDLRVSARVTAPF